MILKNMTFVINVPKLKTHGMMGMTLGVKNTFGFIHAFEKAKWHFRAGQDRSLFASILVDIHHIVKTFRDRTRWHHRYGR